MAIKKFKVPPELLPLILSDGTYNLRYRMVTNDGNVASDWSDVYDISTVGDTGTTASMVLGSQTMEITLLPTEDSRKIDIRWDSISNPLFANTKYDVYVKWAYNEIPTYDTEWTYSGTVDATSHNETVPSDPRALYVKARIQIATQDKTVTDNVLLAESTDNVSTTYVAIANIDGGVL
jgi:hypothetical protein